MPAGLPLHRLCVVQAQATEGRGVSGKGAAFERLCQRELEACGWLAIKSSDSSRADLIALRNESGTVRALAVEAKSGRNGCPPAQWNQHYEMCRKHGMEPVLADKVPGVAAPRWWRMTGPKSGVPGAKQPRIPFDIEAWA